MVLGVALAALVGPALFAAFVVFPAFLVRRYVLVGRHGVGPETEASLRRFRAGGAALGVAVYALYLGGLLTDEVPWATRFLEAGGLMAVVPLGATTFAASRWFTVERALTRRHR